MKTIRIANEVLDLVPEVFKNLPADSLYKLAKMETNGRLSMVFPGDYALGDLRIVDLDGKYGVLVDSGERSDLALGYIRTSPVKEVLDNTDTTITFRTNGGVYKLERITDTSIKRSSSRA
jgi:hypothetical protein